MPLRRLVPAACLALMAVCAAAKADPINLSTSEQQSLGPIGAPPAGAAKTTQASPACTGFETACSGATASFKAPPLFEYGGAAEAGVAGSNHGFGTEIGAGGWIRPVGSNTTLSVFFSHEQWNGKYGH